VIGKLAVMPQQRNGLTWLLRGFEAGFVGGWIIENVLTGAFGLHVGSFFGAMLGGFVGAFVGLAIFAVLIIRTSEYPEPFTVDERPVD
jgi:uncharacterized membrane protein YeaQ/YmgE (transglycosylase-associated protein family)